MAISDDLIRAVGANIQEKVSLIWSAAGTLRGPYKPHVHGLAIFPLTIIKRFHTCLAPIHNAVLAAAEQYKTKDSTVFISFVGFVRQTLWS